MPADPRHDARSGPPGARRDASLSKRLWAAFEAKGEGYEARTHHFEPDGRPKYVNRLILEASPYLLQHAHNPVDWRPWSEESLAEARAWDRPVFVSVGYATCHWCHVMEEESFDNEAVAQILNAHFVPVKIDREQHPAIDQVYITATQLQQGHAGWPNSVFLLPDGRPFHTGTYFPRAHFMQLLQAIAQLWRSGKREEIERVADELSGAIRRLGASAVAPGSAGGPLPAAEVHGIATAQLGEMHNAEEGGFSTSQQFPQEGFVLYLLDHWRRTGDAGALRVAGRTLEAIAAGGIHDHVGGGFHRYTVDANWRTPHFEKMLYNQAQLARAFIEGWEATANPTWRRAAERAFAYVLRDMTDCGGAFYSAEDADSPDRSGERVEGAFYVWPPEAVRAALGTNADETIEALGLRERPTIEAGPVAHLDPAEPPDFERLDPLLERLRQARETRPRPLRDEKVIAGWNGLMIRALAEGAVAFEKPAYGDAAQRAAAALWTRHWSSGRLRRLWADGRAYEEGVLEDYAWAGLGMLALWDATGDESWRGRAAEVARAALEHFADDQGRLRMAAGEGPVGPVYDTADGATPSGESAMLELLARLDRRLAGPEFRAAAERVTGTLAGQFAQAPLLRPDALMAARILESGESALRRALAEGTVRAHMRPGGGRLSLAVAEGWHVTAHDPGAEGLTGADVTGAQANWPEGVARELGFSDRPVRVYEGRLDLPLRSPGALVTVEVQPCSETLCLAPERAAFRLR